MSSARCKGQQVDVGVVEVDANVDLTFVDVNREKATMRSKGLANPREEHNRVNVTSPGHRRRIHGRLLGRCTVVPHVAIVCGCICSHRFQLLVYIGHPLRPRTRIVTRRA